MRPFKYNIIQARIFNGIEILVVTPTFLLELDSRLPKCVLQSKRLKTIVFENLDLIHDRHKDVCETLMQKVQDLNKTKPIQTIVTSRTWQRYLWKFVDVNTAIIIGNCMEAAMYGADISLELCDADNKLDRLCGKR